MPQAKDNPAAPDSLAGAAQLVFDTAEPIVRRLPIVGPHVSSERTDNYRRLIESGLDVVGTSQETRDRIDGILGEDGKPPGAVHTYPLDDPDQADAGGQPADLGTDAPGLPVEDLGDTQRYDP